MKRGLTLAETILSLLLVSLLVLFVATLFPGSYTTIHYGAERLYADGLAQSLLEQQMNVPFSSMQNQELVREHQAREYRAQLQVLPGDSERMRRLEVTVEWNSRGRVRRVSHQLWRTDVPR